MTVWFKYFNKKTWNVRIWRKANLKYNQDDFGMFRVKYITRWKDLYFRITRSEAVMRGCNMFGLVSLIMVFAWWKDYYLEPNYIQPKKIRGEKELEENDAKARAQIFYNRMGAPTRPHRSLEDLLVFLAGSKTFDDLAEFVSYETASDINSDQQKGLDSWMSEEDTKMLHYYRESLKHGGGGH